MMLTMFQTRWWCFSPQWFLWWCCSRQIFDHENHPLFSLILCLLASVSWIFFLSPNTQCFLSPEPHDTRQPGAHFLQRPCDVPGGQFLAVGLKQRLHVWPKSVMFHLEKLSNVWAFERTWHLCCWIFFANESKLFDLSTRTHWHVLITANAT